MVDTTHISVFHQPQKNGKGVVWRRGFSEITGDIVLVENSDLEYDPSDHTKLLEPPHNGRANVVYRPRFLGWSHRILYFWYDVGNKFLTLLSNMSTKFNPTDMETGYKLFSKKLSNK